MIDFIICDIAKIESECIVNSTNKWLEWEDITVNGAIQNGGGIKLINKLKEIINLKSELEISVPIITDGYDLKCDKIIHVVPPHWTVDGSIRKSDDLLSATYKNVLTMAKEHNIKLICFPLLSTGAFLFPVARAALIAIVECLLFQKNYDINIKFCIFDGLKLKECLNIYDIVNQIGVDNIDLFKELKI